MVRSVHARVTVETLTHPDGKEEVTYLLAAEGEVDEEFVIEYDGKAWVNRCVVENWQGLIFPQRPREILLIASDIGIEDGIIAFEGPRYPSCIVYVRDPDLLAALRIAV